MGAVPARIHHLSMSRSLLDHVSALEEVPVIGIIRGCPMARIEEIAGAALEGGLRVLEVTYGSEDPARQIEIVRERFPELAVGIGTVTRPDQVGKAANAGASFVVSPILDEAVVARCLELELPCVPGAGTANEAWRAHRLGAAAVKLFPAQQLGGPSFVAALRSPLPHLPLIPTGGVDAGNARAYLEAGAIAVAVGSSIFPTSVLERGEADLIRSRAAEIVASVSKNPR